MAESQGLSEAQSQALAGVQVGDLILVQCYHRVDDDDQDSEDRSEDGSEGAENESIGEGSNVDDEVVEGEHDQQTENIEDEDQEGDDSSSSSDGEIDGNDEGEASEVADEEDNEWTSLFQVTKVTKDDENSVTEVEVVLTPYCQKPGEEMAARTFQIYGTNTECSPLMIAGTSQEMDIRPMTAVASNEDCSYDITANPSGDLVRDLIFHGRCPANCADGWIDSQQNMHDLVSESIRTVAEHSPVCPVCIGKPLMQEFQGLRETLQDFLIVDITQAVEFYGRFNQRRRQLGYRFKQFDEREWGYEFDDMLEGDEDDSQGGNDVGNSNQWGYWPEALDPSSCVVARPTAASVIASLPRMTFEQVENKEQEAECAVCKDRFESDTVVAELPCGHVFCDAGCIESWLKQSNSCPTCRSKLLSKEDEESSRQDSGVEDGAGGVQEPYLATGEDDNGLDGAAPVMATNEGVGQGDEDTPMSDGTTGVTA